MLTLTVLAMLAFAGNSLLCRLALKQTRMGAGPFTALRLLAGALVLALVARLGRKEAGGHGSWGSALALFAYAAGFSFAYLTLPTATGTLLLFGAVQATMIGQGFRMGERFRSLQLLGLLAALGGLMGLLLPGLSAPSPGGSLLMLGAGVAWGVYSLRGRNAGDPTRVTAGNFLRAAPLGLLLGLAFAKGSRWPATGVAYALASGALSSGLGYAIWYAALPALNATTAATVQLSVPVLAAFGGALLLSEPITPRLALASVAILGGIALVIAGKAPASA